MVLLAFGYLANEKWLYQQVIDRQLAHNPLREKFDDDETYGDAVEKYRMSAMHRLAEILQHEIGIPGLCLQMAWIARNDGMLCWQLPERMRPARRTPEDDDKLRRFYETTNLGKTFEEPRNLALLDGSMPRSMPKEAPPAVEAMRL